MTMVKKRENRILFAAGFLIGLLCFLLTYGTDVLRFTYDAWLFHGDPDLQQHYVGWCHYRTSPWTFPVGMIDSLSFPTSVSMLWTDSIPLFAIFFKIFRSVLPETFQYFGLFAFLSFGMQGGVAVILIRKVTDKIPVCIMMSIPFILSYPILHRTFYHTSLSAQWIILLAVYLWMSGVNQKSPWKQMVIWGAMGILCVLIHSYFLPMVACMMCGSLLEGVLKNRNWKAVIFSGVEFCICTLAALYVVGAFEGNVSPSYGVGQFEMNLDSLINPLGYSRILPELPLHFDTQYEGFAYLGAGMILLTIVMIVLLLGMIWKYKKNGGHIKSLLMEHPRKTAILVVLFVFLAVSVCPYISLGSFLIVRIPYPRFVNSIAGIFRSNGRFAWPILYLLMISAIAYISQKMKKNLVLVILSACLLLQVLDLSFFVGEKRSHYIGDEQTYQTVWEKNGFGQIAEGHDRFILFAKDNNLIMSTAYYAYWNDMTLNRYYYARDIDKQIEENLNVYITGLQEQKPEKDCVYIFDSGDYEPYAESGLHFYKLKNWVVGTAEELDGMEEIQK